MDGIKCCRVFGQLIRLSVSLLLQPKSPEWANIQRNSTLLWGGGGLTRLITVRQSVAFLLRMVLSLMVSRAGRLSVHRTIYLLFSK